jgi:hypothetical protein
MTGKNALRVAHEAQVCVCVRMQEMLRKLSGIGFDARGVEDLFYDMTGNVNGKLTREQFMEYLEEEHILETYSASKRVLEPV